MPQYLTVLQQNVQPVTSDDVSKLSPTQAYQVVYSFAFEH